MGKNSTYAEKYSGEAMEQMKRYGIPASVILAQGILESASGQSELSKEGNNHFGIKATGEWLDSGGEYLVYTDDRPNEKFCKYKTVADSYEHHSRFLKNNARYSACFKLSPDDYRGWTSAIAKAGYASNGNYALALQKIIETNGLDRYDRQVMEEMRAEGRRFGTEDNPRAGEYENGQGSGYGNGNGNTCSYTGTDGQSNYSFPLKRDEFLFVTSPFGMRQDPMDPSKQQMHKGIDIRASRDDILATEDNGKVIAVSHDAGTPGGKSVTVEYSREDGSRLQCVYMHLDSIAVNQGDTVNAGEKLGVTGNTGTRTTGEHLHFGVKTISSDGTARDMDPAAYLAEISSKGNINLQALHNGNDLLAKYRDTSLASATAETKIETSEDWMKKLLCSEDGGTGLSGTDPLIDMALTSFMTLMTLALQIDNRTEDEKKETVSESVDKRTVDLKDLVPGMKTCTLAVNENGRMRLTADNGNVTIDRELTCAEANRLSLILSSETLSDDAKRTRLVSAVAGMTVSEQLSKNFEQGMRETAEQQTVQRR